MKINKQKEFDLVLQAIKVSGYTFDDAIFFYGLHAILNSNDSIESLKLLVNSQKKCKNTHKKI